VMGDIKHAGEIWGAAQVGAVEGAVDVARGFGKMGKEVGLEAKDFVNEVKAFGGGHVEHSSELGKASEDMNFDQEEHARHTARALATFGTSELVQPIVDLAYGNINVHEFAERVGPTGVMMAIGGKLGGKEPVPEGAVPTPTEPTLLTEPTPSPTPKGSVAETPSVQSEAPTPPKPEAPKAEIPTPEKPAPETPKTTEEGVSNRSKEDLKSEAETKQIDETNPDEKSNSKKAKSENEAQSTKESPENSGKPYKGKPGEEIDPREVDVFRGGESFEATPNQYKLAPDGSLKTTHGISLDTDAAAMGKFGGATKINTIPPELKIIQRGGKLGHFEIVPREPGMSPSRYQELLNQIDRG
jgi:outer membrane biosynthesis protein TonB